MIPAGARRTKIRPPRKAATPQDPIVKSTFDYEALWQVLANAITQIQNKNVSTLLYEQLYRIAYTLVLQKCGERLYEDVSRTIADHLHNRREKLLKTKDSVDFSSERFLHAFAAEWLDHLQLMKFISDVLMYMNRVYVKDLQKLLIYDLGVMLFESDYLRYGNMDLAHFLVSLVCGEIGHARNHVITSRLYIALILAMFEVMADEKYAVPHKTNMYYDEFEATLLALSRTYYSEFSESALASRLGIEYLKDVSDLIGREERRLDTFSGLFASHTQPRLVTTMNEVLILDHLDKVMSFPAEMYGLGYMLEPVLKSTLLQPTENHYESLHLLYNLEGRVDGERKRLKGHLRDVIVLQGAQLPIDISRSLEQKALLQAANGLKKSSASVSSTAFALEWVEAVLRYQKALGVLVLEAFSLDPAVEFTVFASLKQFINSSGLSRKLLALNAPELLSVYMDHHIKSFSKSKNIEKGDVAETLGFLHKSVCFLKLVEDKHAFESHYAAHFAKRFLNSKGTSDSDVEDLVISKLWDEVFMGSHYLERIVKMRKDVKLSAELTNEFRQFSSENGPLLNMDLKICNLAEWPKSMTKDHQLFDTVEGKVGFIWPKQLRHTMKVFEEFWLTGKRNDNKALHWYPKFGSMDFRITYPSRTYEINMSTYAGIIMLLFAPQSLEDGEEVSAFEQKIVLTYEEIYELTKIPDVDLKRQLRSIAVAPRLRLLIKSPMSKDINKSDTFKLNPNFKSPSTKVKVLTVKTEGPEREETDEVLANIHEGKQHLINASIVRVMKSRRTVKHNDLIEEIIKQLQSRFLPLMIHIKQRIEDLIEKEYLRRDPDSPSVYHYIA